MRVDLLLEAVALRHLRAIDLSVIFGSLISHQGDGRPNAPSFECASPAARGGLNEARAAVRRVYLRPQPSDGVASRLGMARRAPRRCRVRLTRHAGRHPRPQPWRLSPRRAGHRAQRREAGDRRASARPRAAGPGGHVALHPRAGGSSRSRRATRRSLDAPARACADELGRPILIPADDAASVFVDDHTEELAEDFLLPRQPRGTRARAVEQAGDV